jgi:hypothetical protein
LNRVCQFLSTPTTSHWALVKQILRYLRASIDLGLCFTKSTSSLLSAFSDVDWAGNPNDRRSTGGFTIFFGGNLISWGSQKHSTVSSKSFFVSLGFLRPPTLWCDNIGVTYLMANPIFHYRMKHVEINYHFVRERVASRQLDVRIISSNDQVADIMTKPLAGSTFSKICTNLNLISYGLE